MLWIQSILSLAACAIALWATYRARRTLAAAMEESARRVRRERLSTAETDAATAAERARQAEAAAHEHAAVILIPLHHAAQLAAENAPKMKKHDVYARRLAVQQRVQHALIIDGKPVPPGLAKLVAEKVLP